jgi:hypothetical protein
VTRKEEEKKRGSLCRFAPSLFIVPFIMIKKKTSFFHFGILGFAVGREGFVLLSQERETKERGLGTKGGGQDQG